MFAYDHHRIGERISKKIVTTVFAAGVNYKKSKEGIRRNAEPPS
jgi:hypothetical protein